MWGIDVAFKDFEDAVLCIPIFRSFNFSKTTLIAKSSRMFQASSMSTADTWESKLMRDIAAQLPFGELRTMIGKATRLFRSSEEDEAYKIISKAIFYARYGSDARFILSLWKAQLDAGDGRTSKSIAGLTSLVEGDKRFHNNGEIDVDVIAALDADASRFHYGLSSEYQRIEKGGLVADVLMLIGSLIVADKVEFVDEHVDTDPFVERALHWYSRCLLVNPEHPEALWNRSRLHMYYGDKRLAIMDLLALANVASRISKQQMWRLNGEDCGTAQSKIRDTVNELGISKDVAKGQIHVCDVLKKYELALDHRLSEKVSHLCKLQGELASALHAVENATIQEHANYKQDNAQRQLMKAQKVMRVAVKAYLHQLNASRSDPNERGAQSERGEEVTVESSIRSDTDFGAALDSVKKAILMSFPPNEDISDIAALASKGSLVSRSGKSGSRSVLDSAGDEVAHGRADKAARKAHKKRKKRREERSSMKRTASKGLHLKRRTSRRGLRERTRRKQKKNLKRPRRPQAPRKDITARERASRGWRVQQSRLRSRSRSNSVASSAGESEVSSWSDSASDFSDHL